MKKRSDLQKNDNKISTVTVGSTRRFARNDRKNSAIRSIDNQLKSNLALLAYWSPYSSGNFAERNEQNMGRQLSRQCRDNWQWSMEMDLRRRVYAE